MMPEEPSSEVGPGSVAAPFDPKGPRGLQAGGCSRYGLIGCGLLTLVLGVAAIGFLLKAGDLFAWAMSRFETEIVEGLPDDIGDRERRRLHEAFAAATEAVRTGNFDPIALQELQARLRASLLREERPLDQEDVMELIRLLEAVGGEEDKALPEPVEESLPAAGAEVTA